MIEALAMLASPERRAEQLKFVVSEAMDGFNFAREVRHPLIHLTCRAGMATVTPFDAHMIGIKADPGIDQVFDVLVVEVPLKLRGKRIFIEWFEYMLRQAVERKFVVRFHIVVNLRLQDLLLKCGFIMDEKDYFVHPKPKTTLENLWSITNAV